MSDNSENTDFIIVDSEPQGESSKRKKLEFAICYKLFRAVDPVGPSTTLRLGIPTL